MSKAGDSEDAVAWAFGCRAGHFASFNASEQASSQAPLSVDLLRIPLFSGSKVRPEVRLPEIRTIHLDQVAHLH
jgi:hypothetical protein